MESLKLVVTAASILGVYFSAILLAMSMFLWQAEGMFWSGIALIVTGVATRLSVDWLLKEV
jgi:hypothetical protein